jgi:hypothetical protein
MALGAIGKTILDQMGGRRMLMMIGASQVIDLAKGIGIKWPNRQRSKGNYVTVTLRGDDTYDMEFFNVSLRGKKSVKKHSGVYADQLVELFEGQTGWYMRMASRRAAGKLAVNIPKKVDDLAEDIKKKNPTYDDAQAFATAWSVYCRYVEKDSPHCQKDQPSDYFPGRKASAQSGATVTNLRGKIVRLAHARPEYRAELLGLLREAKGPLPPGFQENIDKMKAKSKGKPKKDDDKGGKKDKGGLPDFLKDKGKKDDDGDDKPKADKPKKGEVPEAFKKHMKKKKASGFGLLKDVVDYTELVRVHRSLAGADDQSAKLLREVMAKLGDELELSRGAQEALQRLRGIASQGKSWDTALLRNNIFKAANSLGLRLPSAMF